jgi:hypothetical protein
MLDALNFYIGIHIIYVFTYISTVKGLEPEQMPIKYTALNNKPQ